MSLIADKGYEAITVQNIIDRADLGRSTFYAHYHDKEHLLLSGMEEMLHSLPWRMESPPDGDRTDGERPLIILPTLQLFRHLKEQNLLYRAMVGGRGIDLVFKKIHNHLSDQIEEQIQTLQPSEKIPTVPPAAIANYLAGALLNLLTWWLDGDMPYPPERMDEMFQQLTMPGVGAALGINL